MAINWNEVRHQSQSAYKTDARAVQQKKQTKADSPSSIDWNRVYYTPNILKFQESERQEAAKRQKLMEAKKAAEQAQLERTQAQRQAEWDNRQQEIASFIRTQQAKQSGAPFMSQIEAEIRSTPESELKDPMVQFASGAYEATFGKTIDAINKLGGKKQTAAGILAEVSAPYSDAWRTAGRLYGGTVQNLAMYGTVGKAAEGFGALQKIGSPFLRNLAGQQLADTLIQTPGVIVQGIADKKPAGEVLKDVGIQQGQDLAANLIFGGLEAGLSRLSRSRAAKQAAKTVDDIPPIGGKTTADSIDDQVKRLDDYFVSRRTAEPTANAAESMGIPRIRGEVDTPKARILGEPPRGEIPEGEKLLSFPQTVKKADITAPELKQIIENNPLSYKPINNPDTLKYAQELVNQNFEAAKALVKQGKSFSNATESAMALEVIRQLQNNRQWDEAFEVMAATARKAKTSGQTIQAFSMWSRMTPEGMLRYADKVITESGGKMTKEFAEQITEAMERINTIGDTQQLRNFIMRQAGEMPEWAYRYMSGKTAEQLKEIAIAQVLSDIADQVPKSAWKKVSTLQAAAHLISPKTGLKNIGGNISFGLLEKVSNALATPFDAIASIFTGRRSLTLPRFRGTFQKGLEQAREAAFDVALGIDRTNVSMGKFNVPSGSVFKGRIGKGIEKALSYELNIPDEFFKGQVYDDVLRQQMKVAGVTTPTQEMIEYATYRARYATFQDDSLPARIMQGFKDLLNKVGVGEKVVGKSGMRTREFGLGDFVIKYTTVPGNMISRTVEYTPAGLFKILSIAKDTKLSGTVKQAEIAMTIGRALTGTSIIAGGALLRRAGLLISEDRDRSKKATALDRAEGLGNYKVNISALERLLDGGDPTPQAGDILYSYDWIEPLGAMLAVGAEIDKQIEKSGESTWKALTDPAVLAKSANAAMEEILDIDTLYVIRQMTYRDNAFDVMITPFAQALPGFIPSPIRQYAQTIDPVARITKGSNLFETAYNRLIANIPEARKSLEPKISPFGQEITYPSSPIGGMVLPGQLSRYTPSEVTPALKQIEDITGKTDHYPRDSAPASFQYKGEKIVLTPEEKTLYMQIEGQEVLRLYREILAEGVSEQNAEKMRERLIKAQSKAHDTAKDEILRRRDIIKKSAIGGR